MDDQERTVRRIRTEEVVDAGTPPAQPVAAPPPAPADVAPGVTVASTTPVATATAAQERVITDRAVISDRPTTLDTVRRIVTLLFGILQGLLVIRIILLLLVANRENEIVRLILGVTEPFVAPFADMFALERIGSEGGSVLDIGAIVALIGWTLIELLILAVLNLGSRRSRVETY